MIIFYISCWLSLSRHVYLHLRDLYRSLYFFVCLCISQFLFMCISDPSLCLSVYVYVRVCVWESPAHTCMCLLIGSIIYICLSSCTNAICDGRNPVTMPRLLTVPVAPATKNLHLLWPFLSFCFLLVDKFRLKIARSSWKCLIINSSSILLIICWFCLLNLKENWVSQHRHERATWSWTCDRWSHAHFISE